MIKHTVQKTVVGVMALSQFGCMIAPNGWVGSKGTRKHTIRIENRSSADLAVHAFMNPTSKDQDCWPSHASQQARVPSRSMSTIELELECLGDPPASVRIEMVRDYDVGVIGIEHEEIAAKLTPGFMFELVNKNGTLRVPIMVVGRAQVNLEHPNPWTFPYQEAAPIAWLSGHSLDDQTFWRLNIAIPKTLADERLDVAFSQDSGINHFGSYPVKLHEGYFVSNFTRFDGEPVWMSFGSKYSTVVCDDIGCVSQDL